MLQLKNSSPFKATIAVLPNEDAIDTAYVIVKGTFAISDTVTLAEEQIPVTLADEYWGEPGESSLKYASEMHLCKLSTDVVLVGHARAPRGRKVEELDVELAVGKRRKVVRVFGDRVAKAGFMGASISPPEPFSSMPLVYERAYGGVVEPEEDGGEVLAEERNPVGVGFRGKRKPKELDGMTLPNLEDPGELMKKPGDPVSPTGFGFVAPSWLPRRGYAGTYDEGWQKKRAPYLPEDFDSRFFNAAHPDLVSERYLEGGEPVEILNVGRGGRIRFRLPACEFAATVKIAGRTEEPPVNLETVLIEPDEERLCLTWRAAVACDKQALKIEEIAIDLENPQQGWAT